MTGGIFLMHGARLVEMKEEAYDAESALQELLATYPNLLAGDQINSVEPRRWLLIAREVGLPSDSDGIDRWAIDHLFLDQDSIPTIIETKRSSDNDIRRKIVGQMLDYAAHAVLYWPVEKIRATFEARCERSNRDPVEELAEFLNGYAEPEEFWRRAKDNLLAGRVRLVFVADQIPSELQRIVEFLNGQMSPAEVLAVEVRQFTGEGQRALVPRVLGLTSVAQTQKTSSATGGRQWNELSFLATLEARTGPGAVRVARRLLDWATARGLRIWWGKGRQDGSFFPILDHHGEPNWTIAVWTYGKVEIQFGMLLKRPPFDDEANRKELLRRLNSLLDIPIPENAITRRPSIPLGALATEQPMSEFVGTLDWLIGEIRKQ